MAQHMLSPVETGYVDKRRTGSSARSNSHNGTTKTVFTANAGGTTTTIVGANAAPGTNDSNVIRRGEKFRLYNSSGTPKEETVFTVTTVAVAASTTVTFTPAATNATASGDTCRLISGDDYLDHTNLDSRLNTLNSTSYTQARLDTMTQNDKVYALRLESDPTGI